MDFLPDISLGSRLPFDMDAIAFFAPGEIDTFTLTSSGLDFAQINAFDIRVVPAPPRLVRIGAFRAWPDRLAAKGAVNISFGPNGFQRSSQTGGDLDVDIPMVGDTGSFVVETLPAEGTYTFVGIADPIGTFPAFAVFPGTGGLIFAASRTINTDVTVMFYGCQVTQTA